ncbi:MAG TPA: glycosyltransferase family 2 protein [Nitrospira sp.]|nr:glycosyltransferase family 2 protein [Nitrospira sp.]
MQLDPTESLHRATVEAVLREREKLLSQVTREKDELNAELVAAKARLAELAGLKAKLGELDNSLFWRAGQGWFRIRQRYLDHIPGVKRTLRWGRAVVMRRSRHSQVRCDRQDTTPAATDVTTPGKGLPIASKRASACMQPLSSCDNASSLGGRVSVVVPTLNAGRDLPVLLKALRSQQGVDEPEIIVVDSGSTDGTPDVASGYGAKVISIRPEEFSHSFARNTGAARAEGEYLLFMVQDACPASRFWLHELLRALTSADDVAAVSCAELPRVDCDLFYRTQAWRHCRFLDADGTDKVMSAARGGDYTRLRKNAQLGNTACLVRAEVFRKYGFRGSYGEDLDLGIRLVRDGYRLAFLGTTRVIHSHTRAPSYFLKRGYVDVMFLSAQFSDFPRTSVDGHAFAADILSTLGRLRNVADRLDIIRPGVTVEQFFRIVNGSLADSQKGASIVDDYDLGALSAGCLDQPCVALLSRIVDSFPANGEVCESVLCRALLSEVRVYEDYMRLTYETVDDELLREFKAALYKTFALQCGGHLAYCLNGSRAIAASRTAALHAALVAGV